MTDDPAQKTVKAHCPTCDGERMCSVHGAVYKPWDYHDRQGNGVNGGIDHSLLECRGCETVFYEASSWNSEDVDYWYDEMGETQGEHPREKVTYPRPEGKPKPVWLGAMAIIDAQLYDILNEVYVAYGSQSYILTAIGLRTALDRGTEVLGIDPAISFAEKLTALKDGGWIGDTEQEILGVVTDAGNAAAHQGWVPDAQEIAQLLYAMEVFLQRAFLVGRKALKIKGSIPTKPKRQAGSRASVPASPAPPAPPKT